MSAFEVPPESPQRPKRDDYSAVLLTFAGLIVIAGACASVILWIGITLKEPNTVTWGSIIYLLLGTMVIAAVISIAGIAWLPKREPSLESVRGTRRLWLKLAGLILAHCFLALSYNKHIPGNDIDTFTFQRDACKSLLQGVDPYGTTQANIFDAIHTKLFFGPGMVVNGRVQVGFQYPPLTLLWVLPGYLLGDVRYSYILAVVISALLSFTIRPDARGLLIVSILLFSPLTLMVENRCWTEPLVLMTLSAVVYVAVKKRRWLPLALGLFLATKQYNFLALPFMGCFVVPFNWKAYWKLTGQALAVGAATALPFVCWNFQGMWHDLVLFHLAQPFRQDALSFAVPFPFMLKVGPVLLVAFIVWALRSRSRSATMFVAGYGVSLMLFVLTSKQAFANYYFLIGQTLLLAVSAMPYLSRADSRQVPGSSTAEPGTLD